MASSRVVDGKWLSAGTLERTTTTWSDNDPPPASRRPSPGPVSRPLDLALDSLEGLSVGDALGEQFFGDPTLADARISAREVPPATWRWTDDTHMAATLVEHLAAHGQIDEEALVAAFAERFDHGRGYGASTRDVLLGIRDGLPRRVMARLPFKGEGSRGNGAAMRAAPLGAFFAHLPGMEVADAAIAQAQVTHTHAEAVDGAVAVASVAALAAGSRDGPVPAWDDHFTTAEAYVTTRAIADGLRRARELGTDVSVAEAVRALGSGRDALAVDTVPFSLWAVACSPEDFVEVFWRCVSGGGDRDTTCAIACSIVTARAGPSVIPAGWLAAREPLPEWLPDPGRGRRP